MRELRPAVFLDRDGTVMEEVGYCSRPEDVHLYPGTREALKALRDAGYVLVVITNQSGIGLGYFSEDQYRAVPLAIGAGAIPDFRQYGTEGGSPAPGTEKRGRDPAPRLARA